MDKLLRALEEVKDSAGSGTDSVNALNSLLYSLCAEGVNHKEACEMLVKSGVLADMRSLINAAAHKVTDSSPTVELPATAAANLVAELAKEESLRETCHNEDLIPGLLALLSSPSTELLIQVCRALGNICFDNDKSRSLIESEGGVTTLLSLMDSHLNSEDDKSAKLRHVLCGFLLNLSNTHASVQGDAVKCGAIELLDRYLTRLAPRSDDEPAFNMALMCVGSLADSEIGKQRLAEYPISVTIANLLSVSNDNEHNEYILELLASLAESDAVKLQLTEPSIVSTLLSLASLASLASPSLSNQQQQQEEQSNAAQQKLAADLLVLLLTAEKSMIVLFDDGNGELFKQSLRWLKTNDLHLQVSGALAIGNFATKDDNCLLLANDEIFNAFSDILKQSDVAPTLQHACFSALRNLSIPADNKRKIVQTDLLDVVLKWIHTDVSPVQFKLLGFLRMIVDGQEKSARKLGGNDQLLQQLVKWSNFEDHVGVQGEARRLVAWLAKHSHSNEVLLKLAEHGAVAQFIELINAKYPVMKNEGLIALSLVASSCLNAVETKIMSSKGLESLKTLLTDSGLSVEILSNAIQIVKLLSSSDILKLEMKNQGFSSVLDELNAKESDMIKRAIDEARTSLMND